MLRKNNKNLLVEPGTFYLDKISGCGYFGANKDGHPTDLPKMHGRVQLTLEADNGVIRIHLMSGPIIEIPNAHSMIHKYAKNGETMYYSTGLVMYPKDTKGNHDIVSRHRLRIMYDGNPSTLPCRFKAVAPCYPYRTPFIKVFGATICLLPHANKERI